MSFYTYQSINPEPVVVFGSSSKCEAHEIIGMVTENTFRPFPTIYLSEWVFNVLLTFFLNIRTIDLCHGGDLMTKLNSVFLEVFD